MVWYCVSADLQGGYRLADGDGAAVSMSGARNESVWRARVASALSAQAVAGYASERQDPAVTAAHVARPLPARDTEQRGTTQDDNLLPPREHGELLSAAARCMVSV